MIDIVELLDPLKGWFIYIPFIIISFLLIIASSVYYKKEKVFNVNDNKLDNNEISFLQNAFFFYVGWALIQQIIVLVMFYLFKYILELPDFLNIILSAYIFSMLGHFPNILLMFAVGFMEVVLLTIFCYYPNIFFISLTHGILATTLKHYFNEDMHKNFYVLWNFFKNYKKLK